MIHYGLRGAEVNCEHVNIDVPILPERESHNRNFNAVAGPEIGKRKSPDDLIVCFFGAENSAAALMHPELKIIEPSIGYRTNAVFSNYRVFTSYAHMHMYYGERGMLMNPSWYDAVIPNPFTVSEFEYKKDKQDYFLYLGRVCKEKGVDLAIQATEKLGAKLVIAGPGDLREMGYNKIPDHVECVGLVNQERRKDLLANAKCLIGLTYYVEPFGNMVVEASLSGTPVITTDWGGFAETVVECVTGYRIRNFKELLTAMDSIEHIDPWECRRNGLQYSDEIIHNRHDEYLQKVIKNDFYA
jgi:glycosyltransferase involved in cell wall biosynthesis